MSPIEMGMSPVTILSIFLWIFGALDGGSPMSPVHFKKWQCPLSLFFKCPCRFLNSPMSPADLKKRPRHPVKFKGQVSQRVFYGNSDSRPSAASATRVFFAFNSGNLRVERVKHRTCGRVSIGRPRFVATAVVKGQCRCSSGADVWFYGFQINILLILSMIQQYFPILSFRDDSARN